MRLLLLVLLLAAQAFAATLSLLPLNGQIDGAPGQTIGWGYTLFNDDPTNFLVTTGISSDPFSAATPQVLFEFPVVGPGVVLSVPLDLITFRGLYAIRWDDNAPVGTTNLGNFGIAAEWWSDDPLNGGVFIGAADLALAPYSAEVAVSSVPEPSQFFPIFFATLVVVWRSFRVRCGANAFKR